MAQKVRFRRLVLSEEFRSEGAAVGDFNGDGVNDIVSGPLWYEGPDFRKRHAYASGDRFSIKRYSEHFFSFVHDFNADGCDDILVVGMPGQPAAWFENPGAGDKASATLRPTWQHHIALDDAGGESPAWVDLTGDGRAELVCVHRGRYGYAEPNPETPMSPWSFTAISPGRNLGIFTHGMGIGDVDGDGRADLLTSHAWYQQTIGDAPFVEHAAKFAESGGSQMFAYDFDGDGDNDVVSVQNAHAWGLTWFERRGSGQDVLWIPHPILTERRADNPFGVAISQMHALALADIDGDGIRDLVTGKRFFAHGGADPGAFQLPVLYWLRTIRKPHGEVEFEPHLIDERVGVGTQLTVDDVNNDGRLDLIVGNKLGTFVLLNEDGVAAAAPRTGIEPGTAEFSRGVRETPPMPPDDEARSFILPPGFQASLVAAEPDIAKPMNIAFDARGRLWVTSTVEYPYPVPEGTEGRDTVKVLEDTNRDGQYDKVTTFADGLNIPIGLYPYRDGVICYSIPYIWFLRDTDGDGSCDRRERLYGPFDYSRDTHGMCNAFTRGYDGWLYACHGFNNQSSVAGADGHRVTMHSGNTFRIRLDGSRIEQFTHGQVNPFGMAYDARDNLLTADCHTKPITLLMRDGYYDSFGKPHDGLGYVPNVMEHLHGSTAIGGIAICSDATAFPREYLNSAFGGNVMTSRVNRNSLIYDGSTVRAREEPDFLISRDPWFRPVDLQFGPDGALYIADFYNRIIGHYEVPLTHPGRDRASGRIWKITYQPNSERRDEAPHNRALPARDLTTLSLSQLVAQLSESNQTKRALAANVIVEDFGASAVASIVEAWRTSPHERARVESLWILHRLNALTSERLVNAMDDPSPLVRMHVQRILGEPSGISRESRQSLISAGLSDVNAIVNRAAALASRNAMSPTHVVDLIALHRRIKKSDVHLEHAIRMALRDHLKDDANFREAEKVIQINEIPLLAGICLALDTRLAAEFIATHMESLADDDRLAEFIDAAIARVSDTSAESMIDVARRSLADDLDAQIALLRAIRSHQSSPGQLPTAVGNWALDLARRLIAFDDLSEPSTWSSIPRDGHVEPAWSMSSRRVTLQRRPIALWSSFPGGEQRLGVYRSPTFLLPESLTVYIAGHDGHPNEPPAKSNFVRVVDANTGETIKRWAPPRSDVAHPNSWETKEFAGRQVRIELVDGNDGDAYAWLAAGEFSLSMLNPTDRLRERREGCRLAGEFPLTELRGNLLELLGRVRNEESVADVSQALGAMSSDARTAALCEAVTIVQSDSTFRTRLIQAIHDPARASELLVLAFNNATAAEQQRLADRLAADNSGAATLLQLVEQGTAARRLLTGSVGQKLLALGPNTVERMETLADSLSEEPEGLQEIIDARLVDFATVGGDGPRGASLFSKHCASCHQVRGVGAQVGPNLDGIASRGAGRLCEDILAPNRNVDVAFRASTIVTSEGQVVSGLIKSESEDSLELYDATGNRHRIDKTVIESRVPSTLSPMPANFADILKEQEFRDLMAYLLEQNR